MERLPYIDQHVITVPADRAATWQAVLQTICRNPDDPATVPIGFVLDRAVAGECLALKGRHLFSIYQLIFELAGSGGDHTEVRAITRAAFPGLHGTVYRALVIGTGAHKVVVRRMLRRIAATAGRVPQST